MVNSGIASLLAIALTTPCAIARSGDSGPPFVVRGCVVTPEGVPFGGFRVLFAEYDSTNTPSWTPPLSTLTGVDGRFCIEFPEATTYSVYGGGPDGLSRLESTVALPDEDGVIDLGMLSTQSFVPWLSGTVRDERGEPIGESLVCVCGGFGRRLLATDDRGGFELGGVAPQSNLTLQARHGERVSRAIELDSTTAFPTTVALDLVPSIEVRGKVTDADGETIEGATLIGEVLTPGDPLNHSTRCTSRTNARGEFVLGPMPLGPANLSRITAYAAGFVPKTTGLNSGPLPLHIEMRPAADIRGRAIWGDDPRPVRVRDVNYVLQPITDHRLDASDDGEFRVRFGAEASLFPSAAIRRECWLRAEGLAPKRVRFDIPTPDANETLVVFDEGVHRDVIVVDDAGRPVPDAEVLVEFSPQLEGEPIARARTDALGRCRIEHLPDTMVEIRVTATGQPFTSLPQVYVTGKESEPLRVELRVGGFLEGEITKEGKPLLNPKEALGGSQIECLGAGRLVLLQLDERSHFVSPALPPGDYGCLEGSFFLFIDSCEIWFDGKRLEDPRGEYYVSIPLRDGRTHHLELRMK